jgi:hypothetical protein
MPTAEGSLVAPWVQLAVENRREQPAYRRMLIRNWREMIGRNYKPMHVETEIIDDPEFQTLRPYLSHGGSVHPRTRMGHTASP